MEFIKLLKKDKKNILICPSSFNEEYFKEAEGEYLFDLSFIRPEDFINNVLGTYDPNAIIMLNKGDSNTDYLTIAGAKTLIASIPFIEGDAYKNKLSKFYQRNEGYIEYLKDKNIIYLKNNLTDLSFNLALKTLKDSGVKFSELTMTPSSINKVYISKYKNIIEEAEGIVETIASLLFKGIDINKIKIDIRSDEYYQIFKDILSFYEIPYTLLKNISLLETKEGIDFYNYIASLEPSILDDSELLIDKLDEYKEANPISQSLYNTLIKLFDSVEGITLDYLRDFLLNTNVKMDKYKDSIEIGNFFNKSLSKDSYLFISGAIQGRFPKPIVVSGLISDERLEELGLPTSKELNTYNEEFYLSRIESIDNVYISYNLKGFDKHHSAPSIISKIKNIYEKEEDKKRYSTKRDYFKYLKAKELYDNYGEKTSDLTKYYLLANNLSHLNIEYNPIFKLRDEDFSLFKEYLNGTLKLSYSSIDNYYKCPTKYFLNNVIKVDPFAVDFNTYVGNFFHLFIKEFLEKDYDEVEVSRLYEMFRDENKEKNKYSLAPDEAYYFELFYNLLPKIHETLRNYRSSSSFKVFGKEYSFKHELKDERMKVYITGSIDLALCDDDNNFVIVDYKTGSKPSVDIDKGRGMQLFIYFNILKDEDKNRKPFALAYQIIPRTKESALNDIKFSGYFSRDKILEDSFKGGNDNISVSRPGKDSRVINSPLGFDEALTVVREKVDEAKDKILSLNFSQTPSKDACQFCNFKEICYKSQIIEDDEGGEDNE